MKTIRIAEPTFLGNEVDYALDVMSSGWLTRGRFVERFEELIAQSMSAKHALAVSNGTAALHLALLGLGVKPGDRVIVPSCSYIATANAVRYCGAKPVFVDVRPDTWTLDPDDALIAAKRTGAVGIIGVNLYGIPCTFPHAPELWMLEDACESHGTKLAGDVAVLSFYGNKIVTCGEGGAVVTNRSDVFKQAFLLHGQGTTGARRYHHEVLGYNYRLTDLQAAVGCGQMEKLDEHLRRRAGLRDAYSMYLPAVDRQTWPLNHPNWVMPVMVPNRDNVMKALAADGIETRPVFPPLHRQPGYLTDQHLPVSQEIARSGLLLPLHLKMNVEDVKWICGRLALAIRSLRVAV